MSAFRQIVWVDSHPASVEVLILGRVSWPALGRNPHLTMHLGDSRSCLFVTLTGLLRAGHMAKVDEGAIRSTTPD